EFSKKRIVEWSGCNPEKVLVVGNGVSDVFHKDGNGVKHNEPFFFCVSNRKGHKNEYRLLESFKISGLWKSHFLAFSGNPTPELLHLIDWHCLSGRVQFTGRLSEAELAQWYRSAEALIFPSLY